jgi:hypothetical protein
MILTEKKETDVAHIYFENDILYISFKKDVIVELDHINEIIDIRKEIQQGEKTLTIVNSGKLWRVEKEARKKAASDEMIQHNIALALIAKSLPLRIISNFYINVDKPNVPTKMFNSEKEAIAWLKGFSKKRNIT